MARVVAYIPDLLFGSRVQETLRAAGHEVELVASAPNADDLTGIDVVVFDLTDDVRGRIDAFASLKGGLDGASALAFYSHVEADTRALAEASGFDLVVPRSRMAREAPTLIDRLAASSVDGSG